jgi:hypothetical protein
MQAERLPLAEYRHGILSFNNASDAATHDDVRINSSAVRFVEASRPRSQ